jgi:hypothetical protein
MEQIVFIGTEDEVLPDGRLRIIDIEGMRVFPTYLEYDPALAPRVDDIVKCYMDGTGIYECRVNEIISGGVIATQERSRPEPHRPIPELS